MGAKLEDVSSRRREQEEQGLVQGLWPNLQGRSWTTQRSEANEPGGCWGGGGGDGGSCRGLWTIEITLASFLVCVCVFACFLGPH